MRAGRSSAVLGLLLVLIPAAILLHPGADFGVRIDASTRSLSGSDHELDPRLYLLLRDEQAPLNADALWLIDTLSQSARKLPGVQRLHSITRTEIPFSVDDSLLLDTLPGRLVAEPERAGYWVDTALADPLLQGRLVSSDGHAALLIFESAEQTPGSLLALEQDIRQLLGSMPAVEKRFSWWISGMPLVQRTISELLLAQLERIIPAVIGLFVLILAVAFRSLRVVAGSVLAVGTAVVWTLCLSALADLPLNLVTVLVPPLVLTLTVAFCMHVVAAHAEQKELNRGLRTVRMPLLMSAVTTAAGLAALAFNPVPAIQQFAWLSVAGTGMAALCALTVLPLVLGTLKEPPQLWPPINAPIIRGAERVASLVMRRSKRVLQMGVLLCVVGLIGASRVETGTNYFEDLPADSPVSQGLRAIERDFGGAMSFDINIVGAGRDAVLLPDVLMAVDKLQQNLRGDAGIADAISLVDYVKRVHQALSDGRPENYRIPDDAALIKQLMLIGAPDEARAYTDTSFSRLRIRVVSRMNDTRDLAQLLQRVEDHLDRLPPGMEARISGDAQQAVTSVEQLTSGQTQALGFAMLSIFVVLAIMFASLRVAALALLPNLIPVAVFFALLGFSGTPLGPTTALIACIVMGIAVDDTLHFLGRFNMLARELADEEGACRQAIREVIRPITLTTVIVCAGFLCLATSPFRSHVAFGLFSASTLIIAWFSDLLLAPAVSVRAHIVTIWDRLRFDLGQDPHLSIPLFDGMTARQARTFGLAATERHVSDGETFIRRLESDNDMYVIIDGEVRVWIEGDKGEVVELDRLGRGAMLGESAQFTEQRSANASALGPVRLLQFDAEILDRITRRYARIGALIHRNINRAQAGRMLRANQMLSRSDIPVVSMG